MNKTIQKSKNRRNFLKTGLRFSLLGVFVLSGAVFARRKNSSANQSLPDQIKLPCDECRILPTCEKTLALNFKKKLSYSKVSSLSNQNSSQ